MASAKQVAVQLTADSTDSLSGNSATSHLSSKQLTQYNAKLDLLTITDPYKAPQVLFTPLKNVTLPDFQYHDIYSYLISFPSVYTGEALKAYKSLDGYKYHQSGWVSGVMVWQPPGKHLSIITSKVKHSMRLNDPPLKPWVAVAQDGSVQAAHCTCMAGLGEACSHIAATLFNILAASTLQSSLSVTSLQCKWSAPSQQSITKLEPKEGRKMLFSTPNPKRLKTKTATSIPPLSVEEEQKMFRAIASTQGEKRPSKPAILSIIPTFSDAYIPRTANITLPKSLNHLYDPEARLLNSEDLMTRCNDIFRTMSITQQQSDLIESETRKQSKSVLWFQQRAGRVTASVFKAASRSPADNPSRSLVQRICDPEMSKFTTTATKWGCDQENTARDQYVRSGEQAHSNLVVSETGFRINPRYPYLGATPDGLVTCDCCGEGIMEIKCPFSVKGKTLEEASLDSRFCLEKTAEGQLQLKRDHEYFYQVQAQLHITESTFCDFIVYTANDSDNDLNVERIFPDSDFFDVTFEKITSFYKAAVLPNLIAKIITCPVLTPKDCNTECACYCREPARDQMLVCRSGFCKIEQFHMQCLRLSKIPKTSWTCPNCRTVINKKKRSAQKENST